MRSALEEPYLKRIGGADGSAVDEVADDGVIEVEVAGGYADFVELPRIRLGLLTRLQAVWPSQRTHSQNFTNGPTINDTVVAIKKGEVSFANKVSAILR